MRHDRLDGVEDIAQVGLPMFVERCRYTQDKCVSLRCKAEIRSGAETRRQSVGDRVAADMFDIAAPLGQRVYFVLINIKADDLVSDLRESKHQGKPDIAETHDADDRLAVIELLDQLFFHKASHRQD